MLTPFHAIYTAAELSKTMRDKERLIPAFASANIEVYPFQVAAAEFALRSPYLKGAVLADEGSLGKTIEALLVISQLWYEGLEKILLVVPTPLLKQWEWTLEAHFSLPFEIVTSDQMPDTRKDDSGIWKLVSGILLTTYETAYTNLDAVSKIAWDVATFDEAHRLSKCYETDNRPSKLKVAVGDAFKLLMTASPMRNSIMDLYGLIYFIDDTAFGDADEFYKRYFRKPENYHELSARAAYYSFRTLRSQVESYVKIPKRLIVTANIMPTKQEQQFAKMLDEYLKKPNKTAFPKMDSWELTLMANRALSSSPWSLCKFADTAYERSKEPELGEIAKLAAEIKPKDTDKGKQLLKVINFAFMELKKRGANRKAIIFTEYTATIGFLSELLSVEYRTLAFDGSKSSDYSVIRKFENDAEILITTDVAAEGFCFEFCSFIVNFDLPYNTQTLEQRIMRCHRQGQQNDVIVLNFLHKENIADVRTLELINKRVAQFDGIVGGSDDVVGNFAENAVDGLTEIFGQARHKKDIEEVFRENLAENADILSECVTAAENALFTTFTKEISQKVTITPKVVRDRTAEINDKLWALVSWFFTGKQGYVLDNETRTLHVGITPQKVFTGTALRAREYSISAKTITLTSSIVRNVLGEIFWRGIPDDGTVILDASSHNAEIAYYKVSVAERGRWGGRNYHVFTGKSGERILTDEACRAFMELPIIQHTTGHETYGERDGISKLKPPHHLDKLLDTVPIVKQAATETEGAIQEEINRLTEAARRQKNDLTRDVERQKRVVKQLELNLESTKNIADRVRLEKLKTSAIKELKIKGQNVFLNEAKISAETELQIAELTTGLEAKVTRLFAIQIRSANNG